MSKYQFEWTLAIIAGAVFVYLASSALPRSVTADQVLPGGQAAKIRSFSGAIPSEGTLILTQAVQGDHGLIITDISTQYQNAFWSVHYYYQSEWKPVLYWNSGPQPTASFLSGHPVPHGVPLRVTGPPGAGVTVSGYVY